jgi:hypothetical protein
MENLVNRFRKGAGRVGFEAEKQRRMLQLQNELRGVKKQLEEGVVKVGEKVLELHEQGQLDHADLTEVLEEVAALKAEVVQKEEEIEATKVEEYVPPPTAAKSTLMCPQCDKPLPEGAVFCPECGSEAVEIAPPEPEPPDEPEAGVTCPNCGESLAEGAAFCHKCGTKTEAEE